jgi:hypothetical protein
VVLPLQFKDGQEKCLCSVSDNKCSLMGDMRDAQAFNILLVISSQPEDFFGFRECIIHF